MVSEVVKEIRKSTDERIQPLRIGTKLASKHTADSVRRRPDAIRWLARILTVLIVIPLGLLGMCVGGACVGNGALAHGIIAVGLGLGMLVFAWWFLRTSFDYGRIDRQRLE